MFADTTPQSTRTEVIDTVINAKSVKRVAPKYPTNAAKNGQEGWVQLSFVIDQQGNVLDPIVEDSSGVKSLEKAVRIAIKNWKFDPAKRNGAAIEQCQMTVQMDFKMNKAATGVRRKFLNQYNRVSEALSDQNYSLATQELITLRNNEMWNMAENAWCWNIDASYAKVTGDIKREQKSIGRALSSDENIFGAGNNIDLLSRLFVLQTQANHFAKALDTFDRLAVVENSQNVTNKLSSYVTQIREILDGEDPLVIQANIENIGSWFHKLSRNGFSLADIQGEFDEIEIRCANKRTRTTVASDTNWTIPDSLGQCTVFVKGDKKRQFKLVELPNKA
ncbi:MAG: TonB family protein [Flavobacteriales bacterium]